MSILPAHEYRITRHTRDREGHYVLTVEMDLGDGRWTPLHGDYGPIEQDLPWGAARAILRHVAGCPEWDGWATYLGYVLESCMTGHTIEVTPLQVARFVSAFDIDAWLSEIATRRAGRQVIGLLMVLTCAAGLAAWLAPIPVVMQLGKLAFSPVLIVLVIAVVLEAARALSTPRTQPGWSRRGPAWVWGAVRQELQQK